ncbi:MAG TPA: adenylate/guanylate cyclase domain-containing protein [Phycisphaerae bacterium]|nr:adenylate/guanylate cyclase domain-containing protein [Phycisphaerae bacterium]
MAKPTSAKPKAFRHARLWIASLIALSLGSLAATFIEFTEAGLTLKLAVADILRSANPLPDDPRTARITTIEIDDRALKGHPEGGRWPWPRPKQAQVIDAIASLGPRFIVLDIEYSEAEKACVAYRPLSHTVEPEPYILKEPDEHFRESLRRAGNVVVPFSLYFKGRSEDGRPAAAATTVAVEPYLRRFAARMGPADLGGLHEAEGISPMIPQLAEVAIGSGYTSVVKDPDQAVRRVPLLARAGDCVFPHLSLEMAGLWRFGPGYRVALDEGHVTVMSADGSEAVSVPVDARGQVNMRWPRNLEAMDRDRISVGPVLDLVLARRQRAELGQRWRLVMAELDALLPGTGWAQARAALDAAEAGAGAKSADTALRDEARQRAEALEKTEERLVMDLVARAAGDDDLGRRCAEAATKHEALLGLYHQTRDELAADVEKAADRVRPRIEGRICILGINITAKTDQHKTPISKSQPGVTIYPAAMRTILSGEAFRRLGPWQDWAVAVLAAWLVGVLGTRLPTGWGIVAAIWLSAAILVTGYVAAGAAAVLLPVTGPVLAVVVAFAGVSGYRQLTEAASRRWVTRAFEQYMSPAVLDELVRDPDLLRLGGARREITVIFSDVAGFTPLSERLDPENLVALLQHYLGTMTAILLAEEATLDKYEGDGILAFIGAPIEATDHALRAVRAAIGMQDAVPRVHDELVAMGLITPEQPLKIRVGCSSGPANVGNFGSEKRFDYTAMGDTVNLGGRLEEANRWLNTRILVPETTRQGCGEAVCFRRLGLARIRGKAQPMPLYEPMALEPAPEKIKAVAEAFGRAIDALQAADLDAAEAALADLLAVDPQDGPAQALRKRMDAVRAGQARPEDPWNLAQPKE